MAERRGVAILVGAGDAIGAAVARRFAQGGYTVCIYGVGICDNAQPYLERIKKREAFQRAVAANAPLVPITPAPAKA
jgi:NAD(P)-dependent dehydrogenase (short-subunit alcohol dehydrogenase family)